MLHLNPIQQGQNKLIKIDRIDFYIASKKKSVSISTLYSSKNLKQIYHGFHKNIKQHNCFQHW